MITFDVTLWCTACDATIGTVHTVPTQTSDGMTRVYLAMQDHVRAMHATTDWQAGDSCPRCRTGTLVPTRTGRAGTLLECDRQGCGESRLIEIAQRPQRERWRDTPPAF